MPAFTFEKITPPVHVAPSASVKKSRSAAAAKSRSIVRQMIDTITASRERRNDTEVTKASLEQSTKR